METESPFTKFGHRTLVDMPKAQAEEDFKREFGYPVGVDFMTMKPIYWAPPHRVAKIRTLSGRRYSNLNDPELFVDYRLTQISRRI